MKKIILFLMGMSLIFAFDLTFTKAFNNFNKGLRTYNTNPKQAQQYFKKAYEYIQQLKNKDTSQINYMLGRMYCNGFGVKEDLKKAEKYFLRALQLGNARVNCCITRLYLKMGDKEKAKKYLKKALSNPHIANYCSDIDKNTLQLKGGINETFTK